MSRVDRWFVGAFAPHRWPGVPSAVSLAGKQPLPAEYDQRVRTDGIWLRFLSGPDIESLGISRRLGRKELKRKGRLGGRENIANVH